MPQRKIAFAKTHKKASNTVQNVLLRYGLKYLLSEGHGVVDITHDQSTGSSRGHLIEEPERREKQMHGMKQVQLER